MKNFFIIIVTCYMLFLVVTRIDAYNMESGLLDIKKEMPVFFYLLGEGRSILSNLSILQADVYFHKGVYHLQDHDHNHEHHDNKEVMLHLKEKEHLEELEHRKNSKFNFLLNLANNIKITKHVHVKTNKVVEILPWLYYAAKIDSNNVLAYTLGAFYLADKLEKIDEAMKFLREGLAKNMDSWEIHIELARMYFKHFKNYKNSLYFANKALKLFKRKEKDKFLERNILMYLITSYEYLGKEKETLPYYIRLNSLFPTKRYKDKISFLKSR